MDELITFDILGEFAHFRAFDTTRENISYPFPPRTAVIGLIAGIMGLPRNEYWENHPLSSAKIAIQILNPIWRTKIKVNYLQTKYPMSLASGIKIILAKDPYEVKSKDQRGFSAPVNLNMLRNVAYRIFFTSEDEKLMEKLYNRLKEHKYCYPPYLGHANLLAEIKLKGKYAYKPLDEGIYDLDTIVPVQAVNEKIMKIEDLGYSILFNIPVSLSYKNDRIVLKKAEHVIFNVKNKKLKVSCNAKQVFKLKMDEKEVFVSFIGQ
ncbi:MAG: type I-B CRISPR-associated protein Cas5b [Candidatus Heimdallarchaeum endolithica]|uniref:Type I-B CRISPR-associated protein Cas5b n=1 Tax=Candidatus Heimdallarchaeum endolithica TaxID=2876572 RepID=A0A9Y1BU28_9ARCH|nr:MAG: type I-B CRISPR-associated protein Cas5b [Candidatus Heimdallarchaeum endolithica]